MDKQEIMKKIIGFYRLHYGGINGAFIGLVVAICVLVIGFFQTLFIAICVLVGYYIGKKISKDKNYLRNLLDRFLPPGTYR
ncbi:MAG TPA: DUF2273 domain-containing protein [Acetivibrio sp.]|nr:DUF2273 domain-containing protein [Acetivibrio sp.]